MAKTFWKCNVCGDIHFGQAGPEICPTCKNKNAYTSVTKEEAKKILGF